MAVAREPVVLPRSEAVPIENVDDDELDESTPTPRFVGPAWGRDVRYATPIEWEKFRPETRSRSNRACRMPSDTPATP
jgi:hypothetical protein